MCINITYVSHFGRNGLPFRCCKEVRNLKAFMDWLKERQLAGHKTIVIGWSYPRHLTIEEILR